MHLWLRIPAIIIIIFSVSSIFWFFLGSTAYFQRGMDLIGTAYLWLAGVPLILLSLLYIRLLIKEWTPITGLSYIGFYTGLFILIFLSISLIQSVNTHGWANEKLTSDTLKVTADQKYEYQIELVNLFQRNSHARLYLKEVSSGVDIRIPVDIQTSEIVTISVGKENHWVLLEPTNTPLQYILHTTRELRIPEEKFEIDIHRGTTRRLK